MSRTLNVVRLQFVNKQTYVWVPLMVLGGAFLISLAIFSLIPTDDAMYGFGAQAPLWYFLVIGIQSLTLTFPFSQAMSLTRREFYLGTLAAAVLSSAMLASVFVVLGLLEEATNGFGSGGYMFALPWFSDSGWGATWLAYVALAMLFFVVGFWFATIYTRFGGVGLTAALLGGAAVILVVIWLVTRAQAWSRFFAWLQEQGPVGVTVWLTGIVVLLAGSAFLTLRRATP